MSEASVISDHEIEALRRSAVFSEEANELEAHFAPDVIRLLEERDLLLSDLQMLRAAHTTRGQALVAIHSETKVLRKALEDIYRCFTDTAEEEWSHSSCAEIARQALRETKADA